jgi:hypothetical protein
VSAQPPQTSLAVVGAPLQGRNPWEDVHLQKLWLATQRREWRSLAVMAASDGVDTFPVAEMLAQIAWCYRGQPSCVFDLRDLGLRLADYQLREVRAQMAAGVRVLIALRSASENPTAIPVARQADATVLCIALGKSDFKSARETITEVGRERVLGSILVKHQRPTKATAP